MMLTIVMMMVMMIPFIMMTNLGLLLCLLASHCDGVLSLQGSSLVGKGGILVGLLGPSIGSSDFQGGAGILEALTGGISF